MRYLILRRCVQISLIVLYILAHYTGFKILEGNLSSSLIFGTIPLSDPLAVLQLVLSGGALGGQAFLGALIILMVYGLLFGRAYCAFVCPVNLVTDNANFLRRKLGIKGNLWNISVSVRYYVLAIVLVFTPIVGLPLLELSNPVALIHRGIIFGIGYGISIVIAIWLFDLLFVKNGFCSHLCPVGAFYSLISRFSLLRVRYNKDKCTLCMHCKEVCPEKHVLGLIGKESGVISGLECCNCGRCIEVCGDDALCFGIREFISKEKSNENK
ncbi:quinol dehydrogenase ferredoxin subunit NapH [Helicobacter monodelphidis]|uniref:quinol dehydrogenase ferredoxin subunit NapH n=1 Tax=Helicobacter sp. 15-1451 TaxID=2004995 RepID=UPI000DCF09E7|nr:quinol dehydrogenase ferredoxin subunit NapH [Helicobacter sp. 15-1451]RAX58337.1 quinol dehydrogenase ferredoxin subunit NapH [Helicobacter sp. 15-1451]